MRYQAVIFDLDGTLVDSLMDLAESANEMLAQYGYAQHEIEKYRWMVGNGMRMLIKRCLPENVLEGLLDEALAKFRQIYEGRILLKTRPYEGIPDLLTALKERKVRLAVCTNKEHAVAVQIIDRLFPAGTFAYVFGEREGIPRKPDPSATLDIVSRLNVSPDAAIYIGDSMVDMQTGIRAGMLPVGVLWGFRTREELEDHGGRIILSHPLELLEKVEFAPLK